MLSLEDEAARLEGIELNRQLAWEYEQEQREAWEALGPEGQRRAKNRAARSDREQKIRRAYIDHTRWGFAYNNEPPF